jgi:hypothetical protein
MCPTGIRFQRLSPTSTGLGPRGCFLHLRLISYDSCELIFQRYDTPPSNEDCLIPTFLQKLLDKGMRPTRMTAGQRKTYTRGERDKWHYCHHQNRVSSWRNSQG